MAKEYDLELEQEHQQWLALAQGPEREKIEKELQAELSPLREAQESPEWTELLKARHAWRQAKPAAIATKDPEKIEIANKARIKYFGMPLAEGLERFVDLYRDLTTGLNRAKIDGITVRPIPGEISSFYASIITPQNSQSSPEHKSLS